MENLPHRLAMFYLFEQTDVKSVLVLILVFSLAWFFKHKRPANLPPGPVGIPLLGNIPQLIGRDLLKVLKEYRGKYGEIFSFRIFNRVFVVLNGYDIIREALVKNADVFSERPSLKIRGTFKGIGLLTGSGEVWHNNRRFSLLTLRSFGMGKHSLQYRIQEETRHLLAAIDGQNGEPFDIKPILTHAVANVICAILFGRRYDYNNEEFRNFVRCIGEIASGASFLGMFKFAKYIPGDPTRMRRNIRNGKCLIKFYGQIIEEHKNRGDDEAAESFVGAYLKKMSEENGDNPMCVDDLIKMMHEIFMAGTDTTAVTLRWALLYQLRNPDIQHKLHEELDSYVPRDRLPDLNDKPHLPLLSATVLETMRVSDILPLNVPHGMKSDFVFHGYTIPRDAVIIPSLTSVLRDDKLWGGNANVFDPYRFMKEGESRRKISEFIPFSMGRRACLGEALARTEVFLVFASMLQTFQFLPPEGEEAPIAERIFATVTEPKKFLLRAIRRK